MAYQKILFRTAMCVMACDGEIHDSEIEEIRLAYEQTDFFRDLVFKTELELVLNDFKRDEKKVVMEYFNHLTSSDLTPVQELQILEIILRIIYADDRIDKNEVLFLQAVKSKLNVPDEIFYKRFGEVSCMQIGHMESKLVPEENKFLDGFELSGIINLNEVLEKSENE
ncbi:MAG: TerB family tellurite resistance protein [Saprospiraceae bacterium]|nr:TerB family tellurite resistance protein [Saprospiraceae bacterium]